MIHCQGVCYGNSVVLALPAEGEQPLDQKELHSQLDNQILTYLMRVYNNMAHPLHPQREDVQWWIDRCQSTQLRKQVNLMDVTAEEFYLKYGAQGLLSREDLFQYLFFLTQSPTWDNSAHMSRSDSSDDIYMQNVGRVRAYLNAMINEIWWPDRLSPYNHNPHFPYLVTHYTNSMPICTVGGTLSDVLFNPKYASHVYKVTVVVDNLGNIVWIRDLMPGTTANVMIWDARGPSCCHGQFFDFEMGAHDGAYKGRIHTAVPYFGHTPPPHCQGAATRVVCPPGPPV